MKIEEEKIITFRYATLKKLMSVVNIKQVINKSKFEAWFTYDYKISEAENNFMQNLIEKNQLYLVNYNETKLSIKFIAPILYNIDFYFDNIQDWYESEISCELNGYILRGKPDCVVATGIEEPETPYFFLQEYKKAINPTGNPEHQVLAGMLAAMTLNKTNMIRGSYLIGRYWNFVVLEKLENGNYEYFVSKGFDCLDIDSLKQIYVNLKAVKSMIKEEQAGNL